MQLRVKRGREGRLTLRELREKLGENTSFKFKHHGKTLMTLKSNPQIRITVEGERQGLPTDVIACVDLDTGTTVPVYLEQLVQADPDFEPVPLRRLLDTHTGGDRPRLKYNRCFRYEGHYYALITRPTSAKLQIQLEANHLAAMNVKSQTIRGIHMQELVIPLPITVVVGEPDPSIVRKIGETYGELDAEELEALECDLADTVPWCRNIAVVDGDEYPITSPDMSRLAHRLHSEQRLEMRFHVPCAPNTPGAVVNLNKLEAGESESPT